MPVQSALSHAASRRSRQLPPTFDPDALIRLARSFKVYPIQFTRVRGVSRNEINPKKVLSPSQYRIFEKIVDLTQRTMRAMNEKFPGLPPDSAEKTLDLLTRRGARTVLLYGNTSRDPRAKPTLLGYGIEIRDKRGIHDLRYIPKRFSKQPRASRLIRLFVSNEGRDFLSRGQAFSMIIDEITKTKVRGPIIGMVLTDIIPLKGTFTKPEGKRIWLEAKLALEKRGFEDSGRIINEKIVLPDGREILVCFRWYVYPPSSKRGSEAFRAHTERFAGAKQKVLEKNGCFAFAMPYLGASALVFGQHGDAYDFSSLYPGNQFLNASRPQRSPQSKAREEKRPNLMELSPVPGAHYVSSQSVDAALVNGYLPDVAGTDRSMMRKNVARFLRNVAEQVRLGGTLVVRDTVAPSGHETVVADFDNVSEVSATGRSMARLFSEFLRLPRERHIPDEEWRSVTRVPLGSDKRHQYLVSQRVVAEFLHKSAYYRDWEFERDRSYTLLTAREKNKIVGSSGMRHVTSMPLEIQYLARNIIGDRVRLRALNGKPLPLPALNHLSIFEKVVPGEGVRFEQRGERTMKESRFLDRRTYVKKDPLTRKSIGMREMVVRPGLTVDTVPYGFSASGQLLVVGRVYQRPICTVTNGKSLDTSETGGYLAEQIAMIVKDGDFRTRAEIHSTAKDILRERAAIDPSLIKKWGTKYTCLAHPQMLNEQIVSQPIQLKHVPREDRTVNIRYGKTDVRYTVRAFEALNLLYAAQRGVVEDARLERAIYQILRDHKLSPGPWIGDRPELRLQSGKGLVVSQLEEILSPEPHRCFEETIKSTDPFYVVKEGEFHEVDMEGKEVSEQKLEYVVPSRGLSPNAISVLPVMRLAIRGRKPELYVAVYMDEAPAMQERTGASNFASLPIFHATNKDVDRVDAERIALRGMRANLKIEVKKIWSLGGKYRTTPGATPLQMYPMLAEVGARSPGLKNFQLYPLRELVRHGDKIYCAQLLTALNRAAHAL